MVFIDTGAQHTLMTTAAAESAGVDVGASDTQLVGFAGLTAQPAVLETLELGGLTLARRAGAGRRFAAAGGRQADRWRWAPS